MVQPMIRPETLELIVLGNLPPSELDRLSEEIENDPNLEQIASRWGESDELLGLLRTHVQSETLNPNERVESLKSRLKELREMLPREIRFPFLAPPQAEDEIGRIGIYRVRELLGEGGMGFVFLAEDPSLNRTVALKVMKPNIAALPDHRERFLREARNAAAVANDRVVPIYHIGEQGGVPFFAMPHLKGESLASRLNREIKLPLTEVLRIGREIAEGLAAAHEKGMIHRDVQPGNVWLEAPADRVKLLDFGLSRNTSADVHLTQPGLMLGTPAFMAPEQARNREVDSRADLFSLGILLYRMSTGRSPFDGTDLISTLISVAVDEPTPPDVPAPLAQLVLKLLAKKVEDRPSSAGEVAGLLAKLEANPDRSVVLTGAKKVPSRGRFRIAFALFFLLLLGGFGAYQIILKTENGTLVVDVSDPQVEARFKDGEVKLYDDKGELKYTLKPSERNKKLPPGQYKISVSGGDGLTLDTEQFEIRNGDAVIVRVGLESPTIAKNPPNQGGNYPPPKQENTPTKLEKVDPVRAAKGIAEWAIFQQGKVVIDINGKAVEVSLRSKLPDAPFRIKTLKFPQVAHFEETTLRDFECLDRLDRIEFLPMPSSESFLGWLVETPSQARVDLNQRIFEIAFINPVRQSGVNWGGGGRGSGSSFGGEGFGSGLMPGSFGPNRSYQPSFHLFQYLKQLRSLKTLEFEETSFEAAKFQQIKELHELDLLRLSNCSLRDDWLYDLRGLKVKVLHLDRNSAITDESITEFLRRTELQELNLRKTAFTENGIKTLSAGLSKCKIVSDFGTYRDGKQIAKTPVPFDLAVPQVIDWMLQNGGQVVIEQRGKRQEVTSEVLDSKAGPIKIVSITFPNVTDPPDAILDALESLGSVERFDFTNILSVGAWLQGKIQSLPTEVCFTKCRISSTNRSGIFEGKEFSRLNRITFDQCNFPVTRSSSGGTYSGLLLLKLLPSVDVLALTDCNLHDDHIPALRDIKTHTLILDNNSSLTDECIPELLKLPELKELSLKGTKITPEGLKKLKEALPKTKFVVATARTNDEKDMPQVPPTDDKAERSVITWVLSQGHTAQIEYRGKRLDLEKGATLPEGPFSIVSLSWPLDLFPGRFEDNPARQLRPMFQQLSRLDRVEFRDKHTPYSFQSANMAGVGRLASEVVVVGGDFGFQMPVGGGRNIPPSAKRTPGVFWIASFVRLKKLMIERCSLDDRPFQDTETFPALEKLSLTHIHGQTSWVADLANLRFQELILDDNQALTDVVIPDLLKLDFVKELSLRKTSITKAGIQKLSEGLPKCTITSDFGVFGPKK